MTVIMIVASTTISNTTGKIRYFNELEGGSQARLSAESAAELAIIEIKGYDAGYETSDDLSVCLDSDGAGVSSATDSDDCASWGTYETIATGQENDNGGSSGTYYTPIPGAGNAAPSSECVFDLDNPEEVDHPCNWNKILYGDSVTIPLYIDEGGSYSFPTASSSFSDLTIKLRTPCEDSDEILDPDCDRYTFLGDGSSDVDGDGYYTASLDDPLIINWSLSYSSTSDGTDTVIPTDTIYDMGRGNTGRASSNTEISESNLNDGYDDGTYEVISSSDISDIYDKIILSDLESLTLQIEIASPLEDYLGNSIPYLEWQVAITGDSPIADSETIIIGNGYSSTNGRVYYYQYVNEIRSGQANSGIYVLSN